MCVYVCVFVELKVILLTTVIVNGGWDALGRVMMTGEKGWTCIGDG